ncbi:DUF192 domain-containing protein [Candidatus Woesebacteria bacterium]|nr:MAG: DUF192 domain-containing protein [Candidatus Woesebacteria bacterium]
MNKYFILACIVASLVFLYIFKDNHYLHNIINYQTAVNESKRTLTEIEINGVAITVEVAKTEEAIQRGLSGREVLATNHGMLFIFDKGNRYPIFWMKDMKFPLDIIWINDSTIVDISKNISNPNPGDTTNLPLYKPGHPADTILEVNAGFSDIHNIRVGDLVKYKLEN